MKCEYLWKKIKASRDKLFIIREQEMGQILAQCYVVQADIDETNKRKAFRLRDYCVKYIIKKEIYCRTKKARDCEYWPLIREIGADGNFGAIVQFKPKKADQ